MARGVYPDGLVALQRSRTAPVKGRVARLPLIGVGIYRNGLCALSV